MCEEEMELQQLNLTKFTQSRKLCNHMLCSRQFVFKHGNHHSVEKCSIFFDRTKELEENILLKIED